jgi:hypothetical protein
MQPRAEVAHRPAKSPTSDGMRALLTALLFLHGVDHYKAISDAHSAHSVEGGIDDWVENPRVVTLGAAGSGSAGQLEVLDWGGDHEALYGRATRNRAKSLVDNDVYDAWLVFDTSSRKVGLAVRGAELDPECAKLAVRRAIPKESWRAAFRRCVRRSVSRRSRPWPRSAHRRQLSKLDPGGRGRSAC